MSYYPQCFHCSHGIRPRLRRRGLSSESEHSTLLHCLSTTGEKIGGVRIIRGDDVRMKSVYSHVEEKERHLGSIQRDIERSRDGVLRTVQPQRKCVSFYELSLPGLSCQFASFSTTRLSLISKVFTRWRRPA